MVLFSPTVFPWYTTALYFILFFIFYTICLKLSDTCKSSVLFKAEFGTDILQSFLDYAIACDYESLDLMISVGQAWVTIVFLEDFDKFLLRMVILKVSIPRQDSYGNVEKEIAIAEVETKSQTT